MSTVAYTHNDDLPHMITWNMCNSAPACPNPGSNKANALWGALQYYYWRESDGCRSTTCWRNTWTGSSGPDTKLDYIWFPTPSHCREHDVQLINKAESDHHLMRGYPGTPPCPYLPT
jgi:hypothetical protein